jgi:hypothetical protein
MASGRHRRSAEAAILSLVLHGLVLTGMVLGLRVLAPPPEGRAIELRLVPAPELRIHLQPAHRRPERTNVAAPVQRRRAPPLPTEAAIPALPDTPAPTLTPRPGIGAQADGASQGLLPGFRERVGCNDPGVFHLTTEQRRACADDLARLARDARPLALDIPIRKQADYDRYERCLYLKRTAAVPSLDPNDPSSGAVVTSMPPSNVNPTFHTNVGMGSPECPMGSW